MDTNQKSALGILGAVFAGFAAIKFMDRKSMGSLSRYDSAYVQQLYDYAMKNKHDRRELEGVKADLRQILNDPYRDERTKMEAAEVYDIISGL